MPPRARKNAAKAASPPKSPSPFEAELAGSASEEEEEEDDDDPEEGLGRTIQSAVDVLKAHNEKTDAKRRALKKDAKKRFAELKERVVKVHQERRKRIEQAHRERFDRLMDIFTRRSEIEQKIIEATMCIEKEKLALASNLAAMFDGRVLDLEEEDVEGTLAKYAGAARASAAAE